MKKDIGGTFTMKCKGTDSCENEATHEFLDVKSCEDCLHDYWQDNEMGETESWEDFIGYSCSKIKCNKAGDKLN